MRHPVRPARLFTARNLPWLFAAALVLACSDSRQPFPTQPGSPQATVLPANSCNADSLNFLLSEATALYVNDASGATDVKSRLNGIAKQCGFDRPSSRNMGAALATFVLRSFQSGTLVDPDLGGLSLTEHVSAFINTLYRYAGSLRSGSGIATTSAEATITATDSTVGIRIPAGAVSQDVVIIITPLPDNTLLPGNTFPVWPPVVDITTNIGPITFSQPATVGICEDESIPASVQPYLRIAHGLANNTTELLPLAAPPNFLKCFDSILSSAIDFDRRDLAGSAVRLVRWAGQRLTKAFMPATAYAIHGGLGGKTTSLSPFAPVEVNPGLIAFDSNRDSVPSLVPHDIYTMQADGSGVTRIISNNGLQKMTPAWSPDRSKIAFAGYTTGPNIDIYVMNADGTNVQQLTTDPAFDFAPVWSPDGTKIAFHSYRDGPGNSNVYVMDADGSNETQLTSASAEDFHPSWSPDGTKIVFASNRTGVSDFEVYIMDADGSNETQITSDAIIKGYPEWSPKGSKILFEGFATVFATGDIYVMNADGTNIVQLTTHSAMDRSPAWSPLGTEVLFQSERDGNVEVYRMKPDGSLQTRMTFHARIDANPAWR